MKCLIIAAGRGSRLAGKGEMKPLVRLRGVPIIEHVITRASKAGVTEFVIVTGFNSDILERYLHELSERLSIPITTILNPEWEKGNGISVLKGQEHIDENFILVMSDHIFDPTTLLDLMATEIGDGEVILAVDRIITDNPFVDLDDVTRVREKEGRIVDIGKHIGTYNAFDTGMFLCTPGLFDAIRRGLAEHGNESLSGGMEILSENGKALTFDIGGRFWIDIDSDEMFTLAEQVLEKGRS